jgi:hypothetical protein
MAGYSENVPLVLNLTADRRVANTGKSSPQAKEQLRSRLGQLVPFATQDGRVTIHP